MARRTTTLALLALPLAACSSDSVAPIVPNAPSLAKAGASARYVVELKADAVPRGFAEQVARLGGSVEMQLDGAGVVVVSSGRADFEAAAERLAGVAAVTRDAVVELVNPVETVVELDAAADAVNTANDPFYPAQWHLPAVDAPEAWATGATGAGARVAILDGGVFTAHPDLNDNVDLAASRSFVPGFAYNQDTGTFWHGTHVAGIVAAEDNDRGVLGVAPKATLVAVKVLHNGSGAFSWVLNGMYYAGTPLDQGGAGADIMNLSLGGIVPEKSSDSETRAALKDLIQAFDRVAAYANRNGTTVIASAGNSNINFDDDKHRVTLPGGAKHVLGISATAPLGWAKGATDFARKASYTNTGSRLVDFAAPGGDSAYPGTESCTVAGLLRPCWVFDLVLSTSRGTTANGGYSWAAGTSMAAPVAAGIAALIVAQNGGDMHPAQLEAALRQSSIDLGKPGKDDLYGHGWVNAYRAVTGAKGAVAAK